jgi:hypothetical protein
LRSWQLVSSFELSVLSFNKLPVWRALPAIWGAPYAP